MVLVVKTSTASIRTGCGAVGSIEAKDFDLMFGALEIHYQWSHSRCVTGLSGRQMVLAKKAMVG